MLTSGARSKIRDLKRRATLFHRFHPAMRSMRSDTEGRRFITCAGKRDRGGAQALATMSTILFAHDAGLTYVHTPFSAPKWDELPADLHDPDSEKRWEEFFNLGKGEISRDQLIEPEIECIKLARPEDLPISGNNVLYTIAHCHGYANYFPSRYLAIADRLAEKYRARPKGDLHRDYDPAKLNIAVHVRRGDVVGHGPTAHRYTSNEFVASVLRQVLDLAGNDAWPLSVRLYSEGRLADFGQLADMPIEFRLNECPLATFNNLVDADILLMAKSTFSYAAALLSRGVKIYEPFDPAGFVHKPLPDWVVLGRDGAPSRRRLARNLKKLFASKQLHQAELE